MGMYHEVIELTEDAKHFEFETDSKIDLEVVCVATIHVVSDFGTHSYLFPLSISLSIFFSLSLYTITSPSLTSFIDIFHHGMHYSCPSIH